MPTLAPIVTAASLSAASGKNPWLPLGLLMLLAAPESVPGFLMDGQLHAGLHAIAAPELLYSLAGLFLALATAESLADKIPFIERWLVPVSTAWRPFASVAVSSVIAYAAADDLAAGAEGLARADLLGLASSSYGALVVLVGTTFGLLATVGKVGVRLILSYVPVPGLKIFHSFVDDLFAVGATGAGLVFGDTLWVAIAVALYLLVGIFLGPLLARLTWIHLRIMAGLWRKLRNKDDPSAPPKPPGWLTAMLQREGVDLDRAAVLPAYVYHASAIGRCRSGYLVVDGGGARFVVAGMLRRHHVVLASAAQLQRIGLSETATGRVVSVVAGNAGASETATETNIYLFPGDAHETVTPLTDCAALAGLVAVRADSTSARAALPGWALRGEKNRFVPAEQTGSLRFQALVTIVAAAGCGVLSGGLFIPIGAGYLFSPYRERFILAFMLSAYLTLCVIGSALFGWPAALLYAIVCNVIALRDLARGALKARVDGFIDRERFLPVVCNRVWVTEEGLRSPTDRLRYSDLEPMVDAGWRAVLALG